MTSGLDPKSEDEIVHLMHDISRTDKRIVLSVTHSLQHVALYDSVIVLYQGHLVYHATPKLLTHYFGITNPAELYPRSQSARRASGTVRGKNIARRITSRARFLRSSRHRPMRSPKNGD